MANRYGRDRSVSEYWRLVTEIKRVQAVINKSFTDAGLDAVICPAFPTPAVHIKDTQDIFGKC